MISTEAENEYVKLLGFKQIPNSKKQEIEYSFLIKKRPEKEYLFFEHTVNSLGVFYAFTGTSLNPRTCKSGDIWKCRIPHYLAHGDYGLSVGFATILPNGFLTEERLSFKTTPDNTISLGVITLQQINEEDLLNEVTNNDSHEILSEVQSIDIPIFMSSSCKPVFSLTHGDNENKLIIISLPKAGTYLLSEIVKLMGFGPTSIHVSLDHIEDYRYASLKDANMVRRFISIDTVVKLVTSGQFIAGHIPYCLQSKIVLKNYKKIFIYRNLRDLLVSALRSAFVIGWNDNNIIQIKNLDNKQKQLEKFLELEGLRRAEEMESISKWIDEDDVLKISFEEIYGDYGLDKQMSAINSVSDFLGSPHLSSENIDSILRTETLTFSGERSNVIDYWNDKIESIFRQLKFDEINKKLGY